MNIEELKKVQNVCEEIACMDCPYRYWKGETLMCVFEDEEGATAKPRDWQLDKIGEGVAEHR